MLLSECEVYYFFYILFDIYYVKRWLNSNNNFNSDLKSWNSNAPQKRHATWWTSSVTCFSSYILFLGLDGFRLSV